MQYLDRSQLLQLRDSLTFGEAACLLVGVPCLSLIAGADGDVALLHQARCTLMEAAA
ncbi:hypothetical protein [Paludibacterium sp.]|uniref:hypothetical protein n=1 Tax=Paludibacterium sp. TaxID=1917523 RepID=UPI0025E8E26B|nr:hypothetical protein [Paludibacterium sp.]